MKALAVFLTLQLLSVISFEFPYEDESLEDWVKGLDGNEIAAFHQGQVNDLNNSPIDIKPQCGCIPKWQLTIGNEPDDNYTFSASLNNMVNSTLHPNTCYDTIQANSYQQYTVPGKTDIINPSSFYFGVTTGHACIQFITVRIPEGTMGDFSLLTADEIAMCLKVNGFYHDSMFDRRNMCVRMGYDEEIRSVYVGRTEKWFQTLANLSETPKDRIKELQQICGVYLVPRHPQLDPGPQSYCTKIQSGDSEPKTACVMGTASVKSTSFISLLVVLAFLCLS